LRLWAWSSVVEKKQASTEGKKKKFKYIFKGQKKYSEGKKKKKK
jgi:hypothetical protein